MEKLCRKCSVVKPLNEFSIRSAVKDGRQSRCKKCRRDQDNADWANNHKDRRRKKAKSNALGTARRKQENYAEILEYLRNHPCIDCKERDPIVLEFDHRDASSKRLDISILVIKGYKWSAIADEIEKCDVRCANCHRRKTAKKGNYWKYTHNSAARVSS